MASLLCLPLVVQRKIFEKLDFQTRLNLRNTCCTLFNNLDDEDVWEDALERTYGNGYYFYE